MSRVQVLTHCHHTTKLYSILISSSPTHFYNTGKHRITPLPLYESPSVHLAHGNIKDEIRGLLGMCTNIGGSFGGEIQGPPDQFH